MRYTGLPARTGPLTWGQRFLWDVATTPGADPGDFILVTELRTPARVDLDRIATGVRTVLARHEALRTRYLLLPDATPIQRVAGAGQVTMTVREVLDDRFSREVTRLRRDLWVTPLDLAVEGPVRIGYVRSRSSGGGRLIVLVSHVASDGIGVNIVKRDLRRAILGRRHAVAPEFPEQPLDRAALEHSPAGRRRNSQALRYLAGQLERAAPGPVCFPPHPPEKPRYWEGALRSGTLSGALDRIVADWRVGRSAALLAAVAACLGHYTVTTRCCVWLAMANRLVPATRSAVGCYIQESPVTVDLDAQSFGQILVRTHGAALRAARNGQYNRAAFHALRADVQVRRGVRFGPHCSFNYRGGLAGTRLRRRRPVRSGSDARSRFFWFRRGGSFDFRMYFSVLDADGTVVLRLHADTGYFPLAVIPGFLRDVEALLLRAAEGDLDRSQIAGVFTVPPVSRGPTWAYLRHCWVDLEAVAAMVADETGVDGIRCEIERAANGVEELVGYLPADPPVVAPAPHALPDRAFARLGDVCGVVAPDRYAIRSPVHGGKE